MSARQSGQVPSRARRSFAASQLLAGAAEAAKLLKNPALRGVQLASNYAVNRLIQGLSEKRYKRKARKQGKKT